MSNEQRHWWGGVDDNTMSDHEKAEVAEKVAHICAGEQTDRNNTHFIFDLRSLEERSRGQQKRRQGFEGALMLR